MSNIILPFQRNAQISDNECVCVLVHRETKRILTFCRNDKFSKSFESSGYELIELKHASDYDRYCRMYRDQAKRESDAEDYQNLVREDKARQQLRAQLIAKRDASPDGPFRNWIDSALRVLEAARKRKERYRPETFMLAEATENLDQKTCVGEELVKKIICNE